MATVVSKRILRYAARHDVRVAISGRQSAALAGQASCCRWRSDVSEARARHVAPWCRAGSSGSLSRARHFSAASASTKYRAFMLDMDGVLHQFGNEVDGAKDFINYLLTESVPFTLVTNECRYTRRSLQAKLNGILDVEVPLAQIYTAACSARDYFARVVASGWRGNVYVIGEDGLKDSVREALGEGCRIISGKPGEGEADEHCDFVLIGTVATGGPNDSWTYAERASVYLRSGAKLVYTNPDTHEVTETGEFKFGCPMPIVNLLMQTTGCSSYNLGKPNPFMLRRAHDQLVNTLLSRLSEVERTFVTGHVSFRDVLFVGDSLGTDVRTAIENDIDVALVLSGCTTREQLEKSALQPNFVFEDISALHKHMQEGKLTRDLRNHSL
eukprot:TRINITY_DN25610_c1_g1_i1.p1 TRINITY_DN25610_c1_g1~~TRINITY_DN25610_c1_g1_i1.p1  ORF type:complete len:403 (-),score=64.49 TRINITY_DN25610_c1_g1_i1:220-1374(-)